MRHYELLTAIALIAPVLGCGVGDMCGNEIVTRTASPSGSREAVVFERNCGAATKFSAQVSVIRGGAHFQETPTFFWSTEPGNALIILDRVTRPGIWGTAVHPRWVDDLHLILEYDAGAVVHFAAASVKGVTVEAHPVEHPR
jgi:hypothetical protein